MTASSQFGQFEEELRSVTWFQLVIYVQFLLAATILIFSLIGVAVAEPVAPLLLLALLQFIITIPGCVFNTQRSMVFLLSYIVLQLVTGISELIWFFFGLGTHLVTVQIGLMFLAVVQLASVLTALFLRDRPVSCCGPNKDEGEMHLRSFPDRTAFSDRPVTAFPSSSLESGYVVPDVVVVDSPKGRDSVDLSSELQKVSASDADQPVRSDNQSDKNGIKSDGRSPAAVVPVEETKHRNRDANRKRLQSVGRRMRRNSRTSTSQSAGSSGSVKTAKEMKKKKEKDGHDDDEQKLHYSGVGFNSGR